MLELVQLYYDLNKRQFSFSKVPIRIDKYAKAVKLSVIAIEFRDKLLQRNQCPKLLGHSCPAQVKVSAEATIAEISRYIELVNIERNSTIKLLSREFRYNLTMEKRCKELIALNAQRQLKILGANYDKSIPEESDSMKTESDLDLSESDYSDLDDLIS